MRSILTCGAPFQDARGDPEAEAGWLAAARSALAPIWRELDDELHRHEASLPAGFALARRCPYWLLLCAMARPASLPPIAAVDAERIKHLVQPFAMHLSASEANQVMKPYCSQCRPRVPTIGTVGGRLSVRIPVRPGADPTAVLVDVVAALCGGRGTPSSVTDGSVRLKVGLSGRVIKQPRVSKMKLM